MQHTNVQQFPREVQATGYTWRQTPPFPRYTPEQTAVLKTLAREQYSLCGDDVARFVQLNRLLDHYANIVDMHGFLTDSEYSRWLMAFNSYQRLTVPGRPEVKSIAA